MDENTINLDDLDLDNVEANAEKTLKVKNRFQQLANDKRTLAQEKEAESSARKVAEDGRLQAEKERDFFKDFSKLTGKYSAAADFQDKIFEKVKAGYTTEDATVAVLNAEGKLGGTQAQQVVQDTNIVQHNSGEAAGGSAVNNLEQGDKTIDQMTTEEKYKALQEADQRGELEPLLKRQTLMGGE